MGKNTKKMRVFPVYLEEYFRKSRLVKNRTKQAEGQSVKLEKQIQDVHRELQATEEIQK